MPTEPTDNNSNNLMPELVINQTAFLVPAHNEEAVLSRTLESLLAITSRDRIFVVDDGSTDKTPEVARKLTSNVLTLFPNQGKARALNTGLKHFGLTWRFRYIMPLDADTILEPNFLEVIAPHFLNDSDQQVAAVIGKVSGTARNWVTAFRMWEYEIAQVIHKNAQSKLNVVLVCPGPSTVYRSQVLAITGIPEGTLAEDMDATFVIHRNRLGTIIYDGKAVTHTQDPRGLRDYLKQIRRWDTGFWQCVYKHGIPWRGQLFDLEVALLAAEGLFNGFLIMFLLMLLPYALLVSPAIFAIPFGLDLGLFLLPTMIFTAIRHRRPKIMLYLPLFYIMRMLISVVFLQTFFKIVLSLDHRVGWNKAMRYSVEYKG